MESEIRILRRHDTACGHYDEQWLLWSSDELLRERGNVYKLA